MSKTKFTKEGFRAYAEGLTPNQKEGTDLYELAEWYAATLKDEPMTREQVADAFRTISRLCPHNICDADDDEDMKQFVDFFQPLTVPQPRPVESVVIHGYIQCSARNPGDTTAMVDQQDMVNCPTCLGKASGVEGELTRKWLEALRSNSRMLDGYAIDAIWSRIEAERAGWNEKLAHAVGGYEELELEVIALRAELATLKANSIPMPKWEDAPDKAIGIKPAWVLENGGLVTGTEMIPRPVTEREMTPEEMAEAWVEWWTKNPPDSRHDAWEQLARYMANRKTLPQLMAEAGLKTTTQGWK